MSEYPRYCKCPAGDTIRLLVNEQYGKDPDYRVISGSIEVHSILNSKRMPRREAAHNVYPFTGDQGSATVQRIEGAISRCPGTGTCKTDNLSRCALPITL